MPKLCMVHANQGLSSHHHTNPNASPDRDVSKIGEANGRAPTSLGKRCPVDIRVESDRQAETPFKTSRHV